MSAWGQRACRARWGLAVLLLAAAAGIGRHMGALRADPSNEAFIVRSGPAYDTYQQFRARFGSDQTIVVGLELPDGLSLELIDWIKQLEEALRILPHVEASHSIATLEILEPGMLGTVRKTTLLDWLHEKPRAGDLAQIIRAQTVEGRLLISDTGRLVLIVLEVGGKERDRFYQHHLVDQVRRQVAAMARPEVRVRLSGTSVEQDAFVARVEADRARFVPLTVGVMAILLTLLYRRWQRLAYAGAVMAGAFAATRGFMALCGAYENPVTVLLAPILLVVAVGYTVQWAGAFAYARQVPQLYRTMFMPSFLAMATTLIGFLSLLTSEVPAEREFAQFGGFGTVVAWLLALGLAPATFSLEQAGRPQIRRRWEAAGRAVARWVARRAAMCLMAAGLAVGASLAAAPSIQRSTDLLQTFRARDPFRQDTEAIQQAMGGMYPLELMVSLPSVEVLREPAAWEALQRFQQALATLPEVSQTFSLADVVSFVSALTRQPLTRAWLTRVWQTLPGELGPGFARWYAASQRTMRITARLRTSDTERVLIAEGAMQEAAKAALPPGWRVEVTGTTLLLARMSQRLINDELVGVGVAFLLIGILLLIALRSLAYTIIALLTNAVPVAGLFGLMAAWHLPLNTTTAMIASVALGLIFDNTIYLLSGYREARAAGHSVAAALQRAWGRYLHPVLSASVVLAGGFAVTMAGRMAPTVQFGLLTCAAIVLALAADLLVLPALVAVARLGPRRV